MSRRALVAALAVAWTFATHAPAAAGLEEHRRRVAFLASAELDGRLTGTPGEKRAAEWIAAELERLGARPLPGRASFLHEFEFTAGTEDAGTTLTLAAGETRRSWTGTERVRALSFSDTERVSGTVVFAGYGLTVPEGQDVAYDSYAGLDVRDKIVLVLRYSPEDLEGDARAALARYSSPRYKAMRARELGARALLVATGPRSPNAGETIPMSFDAALAGSGIAAASVGGEVAEALFANVVGKTLEQVQRELDTGNPHVRGFELPGLDLTLDVKVVRERRTGHNVVGLLPANAEDALEEYVILGAHLDHLGRGLHGNSLARKEETGQVHHGADDNASGVSAVLAAGAELARVPRRRPIVLAFWSGEELGILGSSEFVKAELLPRERVAAYVNLDMVGRMREERINLQGVGSSTVWPRLIERANVPVGLDARTQDDPYLPTDSAAFYQAGVPALSLFTGAHEDYHRPSDRPETLNYEGLGRIVRLVVGITRKLGQLDERPDYVKVVRPERGGGDRDTLRAFTGTIPDYATEVSGLRLSGVVGGGPADRAGLREGDVIVEFGGREITNIYDYTYALDAVKIDQPVKVVFLREGQRHEATVTPTARP